MKSKTIKVSKEIQFFGSVSKHTNEYYVFYRIWMYYISQRVHLTILQIKLIGVWVAYLTIRIKDLNFMLYFLNISTYLIMSYICAWTLKYFPKKRYAMPMPIFN